MLGPATVTGGAKHGLATLSHAERQAAQNALAKLKSPGAGMGNHPSLSATVFSGSSVKPGEMGASTLIHGQGMDTFIGGARSAPASLGAKLGNDTVVSGSAAHFAGRASLPDTLTGHGSHPITLSADTINLAGHTAEGVKAAHSHDASSAHTITLSDKTTITIAGLSSHDITKLQH